MKNNKFLNATQIFIKACYVLLALFAIVSTWFTLQLFKPFIINSILLIIPFILVIPAGYAVLICLDKLISNIKDDIIFDEVNTKIFKKISTCCFYAAIVGIITSLVYIIIDFNIHHLDLLEIFSIPVIILTCGEAFMGLIVMIVKSVFERAIEIKNENDLTI